MLSKKENALVALGGEKPDYVPCYYDSCQIICPSGVLEAPIDGKPGYDAYGVHQTPTESSGGMYTPTPGIAPLLEDVTEWKSIVKFPDYTKLDWKAMAEQDCKMFGVDRDNRVVDLFCGNGIFERLHFLMGFENALCAIMEEPEAVYDLVGAIADKKIEFINYSAEFYKPDYFTYLDDYSHMNGLFMSPDVFREIFKPHLARIVAACKKTNMKFKQHCCGKMEGLFEDFLDIGVRAFDPVQPVNNIPEMKKKAKAWGNVSIVGGLNVQNVVDRDDVTMEEIDAEVKRCVDTYAQDGGYVVYGASLSLYDPAQYAPGGKIHAVCAATEKYGHIY